MMLMFWTIVSIFYLTGVSLIGGLVITVIAFKHKEWFLN